MIVKMEKMRKQNLMVFVCFFEGIVYIYLVGIVKKV